MIQWDSAGHCGKSTLDTVLSAICRSVLRVQPTFVRKVAAEIWPQYSAMAVFHAVDRRFTQPRFAI